MQYVIQHWPGPILGQLIPGVIDLHRQLADLLLVTTGETVSFVVGYRQQHHYYGMRLSRRNTSHPKAELFDSMSNYHTAHVVATIKGTDQADRVWEVDVFAAGYQTRQSTSINAAIDACGCYATYAALRLAQGCNLHDIECLSKQEILTLRRAASSKQLIAEGYAALA